MAIFPMVITDNLGFRRPLPVLMETIPGSSSHGGDSLHLKKRRSAFLYPVIVL